MNSNKWLQNNNIYRLGDDYTIEHSTLPVGIYNVNLSRTGFFLTKISESFTFNYKIYNIDNNIDYITKYYNNSSNNLGILFNGLKGTGKTVCAKLLCNALKLPVIIVRNFGDANNDFLEFITTIKSDIILFFDEFEKNFDKKDTFILNLLDGVNNKKFRRVSILTTNELSINSNLLQRPSRIRYIIEFKNLNIDLIKEYLKDNLKDLTYYDKTLELLDSLTFSSIDMLKQIVEEINIFGFDYFYQNKQIFNMKMSHFYYFVYVKYIDKASKKDILKIAQSDYEKIESSDDLNKLFRVDLQYDKESWSVDSNINQIQIGEPFYSDLKVIHKITNNYIILSSNTFYYLVYITNPESKSSLFNNEIY